jgi:hypothetical protein
MLNQCESKAASVEVVEATVLGFLPPRSGTQATGYGVCGTIVSIATWQPLAGEGIWRVTLAHEPFGRLVGRGQGGTWRLLQLDDLADEQIAALEAVAMDLPAAA